MRAGQLSYFTPLLWRCHETCTDKLSVLFGNGKGSFSQKVEISLSGSDPEGVAAGDLNGDGKPDIATTSGLDVLVLLNQGDGTFGPVAVFDAGGIPNGVEIADLNADGKMDLAVINSSTIGILLGNGNGTFGDVTEYPAAINPRSLDVADLNGDGNVDLAVARDTGSVAVLLRSPTSTPTR